MTTCGFPPKFVHEPKNPRAGSSPAPQGRSLRVEKFLCSVKVRDSVQIDHVIMLKKASDMVDDVQ
jgi:hypothetical protein